MRWAMIGTGRVNEQMATAIDNSPTSTLQGVYSRSSEKVQNFVETHGGNRAYSSLKELLADENVDVLHIASPNAFHREHVLAAAAAGKHVLCEKPLANDVQSCIDMIEACNTAKVRLGVGFQYRQHPAHREMRALVADQKFGEVVFADAAVHLPPMPIPAWYADQAVAGGGVLPMSGVHRLDLLRFVIGSEIADVSAFTDTRLPNGKFEDVVAAMLRFENGVIATVRFTLEARSSSEGISVNARDGWAVARGTTSQWWGAGNGELEVSVGGKVMQKEIPSEDLYQLQVQDFESAITNGSEFFASGTDGLRAVEITLAIHESSATGKVIKVVRH